MTITFTPGNTNELFVEIVSNGEGPSRPDVHPDTKNIPHIGIGFNLTEENNVVRILAASGIFTASDTYTDQLRIINEQPPEVGAVREQRHRNMVAAYRAQINLWAINGQESVEGALDDLVVEHTGGALTQFTITEEQSFEVLAGYLEGFSFDNYTYDSLKTTVNNHLGGTVPDGTREYAVILDLAFNSTNLNLLGPKLKAALANGDRAIAWYEIRFNSNGGGSPSAGIAKRRYYESQEFGLYDATTSATQIMAMYTTYRDQIAEYQDTYGHMMAQAEIDYDGVVIDTVAESFGPAALEINAKYGTTYDYDHTRVIFDTSEYSATPTGYYEPTVYSSEQEGILFVGTSNYDQANEFAHIIGTQGDDFIDAGGNSEASFLETVSGRSGNDTYYFSSSHASDLRIVEQGTVSDTDTLKLDGFDYSSLIRTVREEGDLRLDFSNGSSVYLAGAAYVGDIPNRIEILEFDDASKTIDEAISDHSGFQGGDDDDYFFGSDHSNVVNGYEGDDHLIGNGGDDVIDGGNGDDIVLGGDGNDTILVSPTEIGSDIINAGQGDDIVELHINPIDTGNEDRVWGASGDDTVNVFYSPSEGAETTPTAYYSEYQESFYGTPITGGYDVVNFHFGSSEVEIVPIIENGSISVVDANGGENREILNIFGHNLNSYYRVEEIRFDDGVVLDQGDLNQLFVGLYSGDDLLEGAEGHDNIWSREGSDTIKTYGNNDNIWAGTGNDFIYGGTGHDTLRGEQGSDTYFFQSGDGLDEIYDAAIYPPFEDPNFPDVNKVVFQGGIDPASIEVSFTSLHSPDRHLEILYGGAFQPGLVSKLTIRNWQDTPISEFEFEGFETLTATEIEALTGNLSPTAIEDLVTTAPNTSLVIPFSQLLANDTDPETPEELSITHVRHPSHNAMVTLDAASQEITYTPAAGFSGVATFEYILNDGSGGIDSGLVSVNAVTPNQTPDAQDDDITTFVNLPVITTFAELLANDSDPDGDDLSIVGADNAVNGLVGIDHVSNTIIFTPDTDYQGPASFDYTVSDGDATDTATASVDIKLQQGMVPNVADETLYGLQDAANRFAFAEILSNDLDFDGDTLSITNITTDGQGVLQVDHDAQAFTYTSQANEGAVNIVYNVTDGNFTLTGTASLLLYDGTAFSNDADDVDGSAVRNVLFGLAGDDKLEAKAGDDIVLGGDDDDLVKGQNGNDILVGGLGHDSVKGGNHDDQLYGGAGTDALNGGKGNDTYHFMLGDGQDSINNKSADFETDFDVIRFDDRVGPQDLWFSRSGNHLIIDVIGTDDQAKVLRWYKNENQQLDRVATGSGVLDLANIESLVAVMAPYSPPAGLGAVIDPAVEAAVQPARNAVWNLVPSVGDETLFGRQDETNSLIFADLLSNDLDFDGDALSITNITSDGEGTLLVDYAAESFIYTPVTDETAVNISYDVTDGTSTRTGIANLALYAGTVFSDAADDVDGSGAANVMFGLAGDDKLEAKGGDDIVIGGVGNDVVKGQNGNDLLVGGQGDDNIKGGNRDDQLYGGAGTDTLNGGKGNDTYHFMLGDGQDSINNKSADFETEFDVIRFDDRVGPQDLWFSRSGNHLIIDVIGTDDQMKVLRWYKNENQQVDRVATESGVLDLANIESLVAVMAPYSPPAGLGAVIDPAVEAAVQPARNAAWEFTNSVQSSALISSQVNQLISSMAAQSLNGADGTTAPEESPEILQSTLVNTASVG